MPAPQEPKLRKGSKAWKKAEVARFYELARAHRGLTGAFFVALSLGVSRQRVYQLVEAGRLHPVEILGKQYFPCDEVEEFSKLERNSNTRYDDYSPKQAA